MRYVVTGANGWIGSAVVPQLLAAGHEVVGIGRSEAARARIAGLGAEARPGDLADPVGLAAAAAHADGIVHLAYHHDFSQMAEAARIDRAVIDALGDALEGSGKPLVMASGVLGLAVGRPGTEADVPDPDSHPRVANAVAALALAERGVRPVVVRFAPTVHGTGDPGFVAVLVQTARERGVSAYVGDGTNRWPAVHVDDAARLVALAVDHAPAGSVLHAVAEDGVEGRAIATAIGDGLGVPTTSIPPEQAAEHFGWLGGFFSADVPTTSAVTRQQMGWEPEGPTLVDDIRSHYAR